jgi:hypothetical protein
MQIDFHHAVTYLCARMAGFAAAEAEIIAYSAQYVDDATQRRPVLPAGDGARDARHQKHGLR